MRAAVLTAIWIMTSACSAPALQAPAGPASFPTGELVNLSHSYDKTTIFWPTAAPFALETVSEVSGAFLMMFTLQTAVRAFQCEGGFRPSEGARAMTSLGVRWFASSQADTPRGFTMRRLVTFLLAGACVLQPHLAPAQGLTGALIGTVKDAQGGVLAGAVVRVSSPALIGGPATLTTNEKGQLRFPALPPGSYVLDI